MGDPLAVAEMQNTLGVSLIGLGAAEEAIPLFAKSRETRKARLGPEHPETLNSVNNLALAYEGAGKLDLALPLKEETLKLTKARLGPEHPQALASMNARPEESLYVGDVYSVDYLGATGAGMQAVLMDVPGAYRDQGVARVESLTELRDRLLSA